MKAEIRDLSDNLAHVQIVVPTHHKAFSYHILAGPALARHLADLPGLPISVICRPADPAPGCANRQSDAG
jgi:hypothetical protein